MALSPLYIVLIIVGILVLLFIFLFNNLITLRNRVDNAWSQIDVQLKRRLDLIPNLVEAVKGYMKHEKELLTKITELRSSLMKAGSMKEKARASNQITEALKTIFAVAENYPNLKANENFMMLQEELSGTESKIAYSRQFYNDTAMQFNNAIQTFPGNMVAGFIKFVKRDYFEAEEEAKKPVKLQF